MHPILAQKWDREEVRRVEYVPSIDSLFVNRRDVYAVQTDNGAWALVNQPLSSDVLYRHMEGALTAGVYQLDELSEVKWICMDFDGTNAELDAGKLFAHVKTTEYAKAALLEYTGGRGFHVWLFFRNNVPAWQAKKIAKKLVEDAGVRCEIFPKQTKLDIGSYGNFVRLPLGIHKKTRMRSKFIEPDDIKKVVPIFIEPEEEPEEERVEHQIHEAYPCWVAMLRGVKEGRRDVIAFTLARRLKTNQGFDEKMCRTALLEWNKKNDPPMKEREVIKCVKSAYDEKKNYPNIGCVQIKDSDILSQFCDERHCPKFEQSNKVLDEVEKVIGTKFLMSPDILHRIKELFDISIAGEDDTKLIAFLLACTSLTDSPQFVVVKGESAAGKSYLINNILEPFVRAGMVIKLSRVTPHALEYSEMDFTNKILFVQELTGIGAQEQFRVWNSEKGLSLATVDDEDKKGLRMKKIDITGVPAFFTTTTKYELDPELETRTWTLSPNESNEQTKKIIEYEAQKNVIPNQNPDFAAIVAALKCLKSKPVLVPFAKKLTSCFQLHVKTRRDFKKLLMLIKVIAFLYQKQRPIAYIDGVEHIVATPLDFKYAIDIGLRFIRNTIIGMPESAMQAFEVCEQMMDEGKEITEETFAMQARSSKKRKLLEVLSNNGYLYCDDTKKPKRYQIVNSPDIMISSRLQGVADEIMEMTKEEIFGEYQLVENHDVYQYVSPYTGEKKLVILAKEEDRFNGESIAQS